MCGTSSYKSHYGRSVESLFLGGSISRTRSCLHTAARQTNLRFRDDLCRDFPVASDADTRPEFSRISCTRTAVSCATYESYSNNTVLYLLYYVVLVQYSYCTAVLQYVMYSTEY